MAVIGKVLKPPPPPGVCAYCLKKGHVREDCPEWTWRARRDEFPVRELPPLEKGKEES